MTPKPAPTGECPRCGYVTPLSGGGITHHKRLRRHKWMPCPGIAQEPIVPMKNSDMSWTQSEPPGTPPWVPPDPSTITRLDGPTVVDKRASAMQDNDMDNRHVAGPDPENPSGPAVILDRITGEVVYRRQSGAKGMQ